MYLRRITASVLTTAAVAAVLLGFTAAPANAMPDCRSMTDTVDFDWQNYHNTASVYGPDSSQANYWLAQAVVDQTAADRAGC